MFQEPATNDQRIEKEELKRKYKKMKNMKNYLKIEERLKCCKNVVSSKTKCEPCRVQDRRKYSGE